MADITVIHNNLDKKGGGEAVCMTVLEALQNDHNITLLTGSDQFSLNELNTRYNTSVSNIDIEVMSLGGIHLLSIMEACDRVNIWKLGHFANIFKHAIYNRVSKSSIEDADLVISTWDEVCTNLPSVQYIHFPNRYKHLGSRDNLHTNKFVKSALNEYRSYMRRIGNYDTEDIRFAKLIANSHRTASQIEDWYEVSPSVLNPPIDTERFSSDTPWEDREDGLVFVGRIHPVKNIEWIIEIVECIRDEGYDTHLHIVGPLDQSVISYHSKIQSLISETEYIQLEGAMYGNELSKFLQCHKYGINGARREQFGMSIAEMVSAGMVPFVPNSGGQREVVGYTDEVMFETTSEAVNKISNVLSGEVSVNSLRNKFPDIESEYGKDQFKREIRRTARARIENN